MFWKDPRDSTSPMERALSQVKKSQCSENKAFPESCKTCWHFEESQTPLTLLLVARLLIFKTTMNVREGQGIDSDAFFSVGSREKIIFFPFSSRRGYPHSLSHSSSPPSWKLAKTYQLFLTAKSIIFTVLGSMRYVYIRKWGSWRHSSKSNNIVMLSVSISLLYFEI